MIEQMKYAVPLEGDEMADFVSVVGVVAGVIGALACVIFAIACFNRGNAGGGIGLLIFAPIAYFLMSALAIFALAVAVLAFALWAISLNY
jgi:hypothetical protein